MKKKLNAAVLARELRELRQHAHDVTFPMVHDSGLFLSIAPEGEPDGKFCLELGMAIMLDKPVFCLAVAGRAIPEHLRRVADKIIEVPRDNPGEVAEAVQDAMREWTDTHG